MKIASFIDDMNIDMHCKEIAPNPGETGRRYMCTLLVNHSRMVTFDLERFTSEDRPTVELILKLLKARALFAEITDAMRSNAEETDLEFLEQQRGFSYPVCVKIRDSLKRLLGSRKFEELLYDVVH